MSKEGIQARNSIIANVKEIENENVLRSMVLVMGDYVVNENGDERASYITPILYRLVANADCSILESVYLFVDALCANVKEVAQ